MKATQAPISEIKTDRAFMLKHVTPKPGEIEALEADIMQRGILVPLLITADRMLIDGHRRLQAAKRAGLETVPVYCLESDSEDDNWFKSASRVVNLRRVHMNEATRAAIATSLEKYEGKKAAKRQEEGRKAGGRTAGKGRPKQLGGNGSPQAKRDAMKHEDGKAATKVAESVGVSRKTYERVRRVLKEDPQLAKRMLEGKISVAGAAKKVEVQEIAKHVEREKPKAQGLVRDLKKVAGRYRTIYADPPWAYDAEGERGAANQHYPTAAPSEIAKLPIGELAHEKDGCCLWLWTTWPKIRDKAPHELLDAWGFRWVGEIVWNKEKIGTGRWLRPQTEVLILAVKGKPRLLDDAIAGYLTSPRGRHSEKPAKARALIERVSLAPRIELFARESFKDWDRWGYEA